MHEFEIAVELVADNKLGLGFSCSPDFPRYLCVSAIQEEVWRRNTKSGYGERRLSVGDALVEINGSRGSSIALLRLVELILKSPDRENLRLVFQHPRLFQFGVAKHRSMPFGLIFDSGSRVAFFDGAVPESAAGLALEASIPNARPQVGDIILSVRGPQHQCLDLMQTSNDDSLEGMFVFTIAHLAG